MMIYRYRLLFLVLLVSSSPRVFADAKQADNILRSIVAENIDEPLAREALLEQAFVSASLATAATTVDKFCYVVCVKRMAPGIGIQYKKSLINALGVRELLKLKWAFSKELQGILSKYKYKNLAGDCVRKEVLKRISGVIRARGLHSKQFDFGEYFAVLIKIPENYIDTEFSYITPDACYRSRLVEVSRVEIGEEDYEAAAIKILEASRYGSFSKGMLIDLYQCYLGEGELEKGKQALKKLEDGFSSSLTAGDYFRMSEIAKMSRDEELSSYLYERSNTRLIEAFKEAIGRSDCKTGKQCVLAAKSYGYLSKDMLMDIYKCYMEEEDLIKGKQTLEDLEDFFLDSVTAEDYYGLADIAEKAGEHEQASYLYTKWEDKIPSGLDLDVINIE